MMITLDAAIAKLSAHSDIDKRGQDVLAAAITVRDSAVAIARQTYAS